MKSITGMVALLIFLLPLSALAQRPADWVAIKDHAIEVETLGWEFPVEIAFVPEPGNQPKDPLYYVTELRGTIKVVTNDRSIHTYAENVNTYTPPTELPNELAEVGLSGLCLDPVDKYLFATTIFYDKGTFWNKIVRFEHDSGGFSLKPSRFVEFTQIFEKDESANAHMIGKCVISQDRKLYVGVGDGYAAHKAQALDNPNGKVLRMNLDFSAPADNPFYNAQSPDSVTGYIWAYGFRNPWAITLDDQDQLYITDNGPNRDRLIETIKGKNYLWDGTNDSMRADSIWNWSGSVGPAGAVYFGQDTIFPYWRNRVVVAQGGASQDPGPSDRGRVTINTFPVKQGRGLTGLPERLVHYKGQYLQLLVPVAEGPDGLYFSGFFPDPDGETAIFKMIRQEGAATAEDALDGRKLYENKGCHTCHQLKGTGGLAGPALDGLVDRLQSKLNSQEYLQQLNLVDQLQTELHQKYQQERQTIRTLEGMEKIQFWIEMRLREPRFDQEISAMPNLQLSNEEVEKLTSYLMTFKNPVKPRLSPGEQMHKKFKRWWDTNYNARPLVAFVLGVLLTLGVTGIVGRFRRRRKKTTFTSMRW